MNTTCPDKRDMTQPFLSETPIFFPQYFSYLDSLLIAYHPGIRQLFVHCWYLHVLYTIEL